MTLGGSLGIQFYYIIALAITGMIIGGFVLWFASGVVWSHRWQDREREA